MSCVQRWKLALLGLTLIFAIENHRIKPLVLRICFSITYSIFTVATKEAFNPLSVNHKCSRRHFEIFVLLFFRENKAWNFMWIVSDDSHEMSSFIETIHMKFQGLFSLKHNYKICCRLLQFSWHFKGLCIKSELLFYVMLCVKFAVFVSASDFWIKLSLWPPGIAGGWK